MINLTDIKNILIGMLVGYLLAWLILGNHYSIIGKVAKLVTY